MCLYQYLCARFDSYVQGNCNVCTCTKDQLDDLEDHEIYTMQSLKALIHKARREGIYPGWNLNADGSVKPRKKAGRIMEEDGQVLNESACDEAVKTLGFQLSDNATWLLPHFFANIQVQSSILMQLCTV